VCILRFFIESPFVVVFSCSPVERFSKQAAQQAVQEQAGRELLESIGTHVCLATTAREILSTYLIYSLQHNT